MEGSLRLATSVPATRPRSTSALLSLVSMWKPARRVAAPPARRGSRREASLRVASRCPTRPGPARPGPARGGPAAAHVDVHVRPGDHVRRDDLADLLGVL